MNASIRGAAAGKKSKYVHFNKLMARTACVSSGALLADWDFLLAQGPF